MKNVCKRLTAILLTFIMILALLPTPGSAQQLTQTEQPAQSSETAVQPTEGSITAEPITGTEVISLREENVKHFDMGNGTFRAIAYSHPVHELDENGQWQDIDFSLSLSQTRGVSAYENKAAGVSFPATYTQGQPILSLSGEGNSIEMTFLAPAAAVKRGASATSAARVSNPTNTFRTIQEASEATFSSTLVYEDVLPNVDLEYIVEPDGVKENIVVNTRKSSYCYEFCLQLENLVPELEPEGSVAIFDPATGELRYAIPAPIMYDGAYTVSEAVRYQLSGSDGNYTLTVIADEEWINAEERVFPVKIDPSLVSGTVYDACIFQDEPDTTRYLTSTLWVRFNRISYLRAPNMNLPAGATLDWATLEMYYYYNDNISSGQLTVGAYQILNNWSAAVLTWNNASNNPNMGIATTPLSTAVTYGNVGATIDSPHKAAFYITDAARAWTNGTANNYGIALKYVSGPNKSVIFKSYEANGGSYKPTFVYQYSVPSITLELQYDGGYAQRYSNAAARITSQADILAGKYFNEFGLYISLSSPVQIQSLADECPNDGYTEKCECVDDTHCINDPLNLDAYDSTAYHHKNIKKVASSLTGITNAQAATKTRIYYLGHDFCYVEGGVHMDGDDVMQDLHGVYFPGQNLNYGCVHDRVSTESDPAYEVLTLVHEFGHRFGARDHYDVDSGDTTASLNAEFEDKEIKFSDNCIYGANFTSDSVIENLLICEGCRYLISEGINMLP